MKRWRAAAASGWAMPWNLDDSRPIYLQLMERIQHDIVSGVYQPGDKLPSVRDLALDAAVNPNTMQKALSELERGGLVYSHRTSGRFITDDSTLLKKIKTDLAQEYISTFLSQMRRLGLNDSETLEMIKETLGGGDNETNS